MGSIVFPAARALVAWLEQHGGNLDGVRALGIHLISFHRSEYDLLIHVWYGIHLRERGYDIFSFDSLE